MLKDNYNIRATGYFKIESFDTLGKVIDSYEEKNLIVDIARQNMCELISGTVVALSPASPINKFVLGTSGHIGTDILTPKTSLEGFVSTRTQLFSEELTTYTYPIVFTGTGGAIGARAVISEPSSASGTSTVNVTQAGTDVTYEIYLPAEVANGISGTTAYTEAGFYSGDKLFNLKTFAAKVKSASVTIRITWKISF